MVLMTNQEETVSIFNGGKNNQTMMPMEITINTNYDGSSISSESMSQIAQAIKEGVLSQLGGGGDGGRPSMATTKTTTKGKE